VAKLTAEARERAVRLLHEHRPYREIAEQCGIGLATVSKIAREEAIVSPGAEQTAAAAAATKVKWAERRTVLVDELGDACEEFLRRALAETDSRRAQKWMTALAIGFDKAQLGSGGVTSRHEQMAADRARERIGELADELAARRAAKDTATGG
jgi:hypothetical protein